MYNPEYFKRRWDGMSPERKRFCLQRMRDNYYRNKKASNAARKLNYQKNRARQLARSIERQKRLWNTPAEVARRRSNSARRRGRGISDNPLTHAEWLALIKAWGGRCAYCKKLDDKLTQDHFVPVSKGGEHTMDNVVPACLTCNLRKSNNDAVDFLMQLRGAA